MNTFEFKSLLCACVVATLILGCLPPCSMAQSARQAGDSSAAYDLQIESGMLLWNGPKRKDNATAVEATVQNLVELLREQHPNANFVVGANIASVGIADLKIRSTNVHEKLEAVRAAARWPFVWTAMQSGGSVDPSTGVPMPAGGGTLPMFVLADSSGTSAPALKVEAFNMSSYFKSFGEEKNYEKVVDERLVEIRNLIEQTIREFTAMNSAQTGLNAGSNPLPNVKFHRGTQLLVVIGQESAVAIAAKVLEALPGVTRSTYSDDQKSDARKTRPDILMTVPRRF